MSSSSANNTARNFASGSTNNAQDSSARPLKRKRLPTVPQSGPSSGHADHGNPNADNDDGDTGAGSSTPKKARRPDIPVSFRSPKKVAMPKPKRANDWHASKKDIPPEASKTKAALETHIRTLWGLLTQKSVPQTVSSALIQQYNLHFNSEQNISSSVTASLSDNSAVLYAVNAKVSALKIQASTSPEGGQIMRDILRTPEEFHRVMFRSVVQMGLSHWAPDVSSNDPDSMYNLLHEHIALKTFEQVSIAGGYSHFPVTLSFLPNFALLRRLYRSFVFSHMRKIFKIEERTPGKVASNVEASLVYDRRVDLRDQRCQTLKEQGFSSRFIRAVAQPVEAHSDDEYTRVEVNGVMKEVYKIKKKIGRSPKFTKIYCMTDKLTYETAMQAKGRKKGTRVMRERVEASEDDAPSTITTLPKNIAIDYFEPDYWNDSLTIQKKVDYLKDGYVVALPKAELCATWKDCKKWMDLPQAKFMRKYGDEVLEEYDMPTDKQIDRILFPLAQDDDGEPALSTDESDTPSGSQAEEQEDMDTEAEGAHAGA